MVELSDDSSVAWTAENWAALTALLSAAPLVAWKVEQMVDSMAACLVARSAESSAEPKAGQSVAEMAGKLAR
jgi:hypothetical protein